MKETRRYILWLPSWYPNRYDPFDGDFIQRHAKAAALYDDIHVLFALLREEQYGVEEVVQTNQGLIEQIIYLPRQKGLKGKLLNFVQWRAIYHLKIKALFEKRHPHLVHVHVPWKAGLMALWIKRKYNLPYVVTEHWGIYNSVVEDNIYRRSFISRFLIRIIFKNAASFVSVSRFLAEGVNKTLLQKDFSIVPNVVDTNLFTPGKVKSGVFTFLHVSNMVPLKNVEGILNAFSFFLKQSGVNARLVMIGNRNNYYPSLAKKMDFPADAVLFKGEVPYSQVAKEMQQAHVLVLNSNIENSPCVISEALCCGLPVIATKVGGIPELIEFGAGLLVPIGNTTALKNAMIEMYRYYSQYDPEIIADKAVKIFAPDVIGAKHQQLYRQIR